LPVTYKNVYNILFSRLSPHAEEIIGDHQCAFRRNTSTTDHILCIRQLLEEKKGIKRSSESDIYRLQKILRFS